MPSLSADLRMGDFNEINCHSVLETYCGDRLVRQGGYNVMDFANDNKTIYVELKSRRIRHNQYPTAIIGGNKIDFCSDANSNYYFAFSYSDGVYAIKYDSELFNTFERRNDYWRGDRYGIANRAQDVVFIPIEHLVKVN